MRIRGDEMRNNRRAARSLAGRGTCQAEAARCSLLQGRIEFATDAIRVRVATGAMRDLAPKRGA